MSNYVVRKSFWLCLSISALAAAVPSALAQSPLNVTATASPLSPAWVPVPTDPPVQASSALSATVNNPPTAPYPCTLTGPEWQWAVQPTNVQYSADNISWSSADSNSYYAWIVQSGSTAILYVNYYIGGYWKFPCSVGVSYSDQPSCGDAWFGTTAATADGTSVELKSLTVTSGATQTNVTRVGSWAAVKTKAGDQVIIQATTLPNNADAWLQIQWTGGTGNVFFPNQRTVDKGTSAKTHVQASVGSRFDWVDIWIIWATVTIQIGGNLAADNNAQSFTNSGGNWPANFGGGNALGSIDHDSVPSLTYAYTIGKIQAIGKLTPAGIGNVISTSAWKFKRTKQKVAWDNGGHYTNPNDPTTWAAGPSSQSVAGTDDTSNASFTDLDPTSGGSVDSIYDADAPGCSNVLPGITIYHTSEVYQNFTQFITVTLDAETTCSDNAYWSNESRVDADKPVGSRIDLNQLSTSLITIPNNPFFGRRLP